MGSILVAEPLRRVGIMGLGGFVVTYVENHGTNYGQSGPCFPAYLQGRSAGPSYFVLRLLRNPVSSTVSLETNLEALLGVKLGLF